MIFGLLLVVLVAVLVALAVRRMSRHEHRA
jgi:hypothetical protein